MPPRRSASPRKAARASAGAPAAAASAAVAPLFTPTLLTYATLLLWLGGIHAVALVGCAALYFLPHPAATAVLVLLVAFALLPVRRPFEVWQRRLATHICCVAHDYFPVSLLIHPETERALCDANQKLVLGLEPHSVLPLAIISMANGAPGLAPAIDARSRVALASSTLFRVPLVKHLWSWLGLQSVDRRNMRRILDEPGGLVCLIPGGASECLLMEKGVETLLLRKRFGFVKMALQTGALICPAFAFGQSETFSYYRPSPKFLLTRLITSTFGFAPILWWGRWGLPIPHRVPITVVLGAPLGKPFAPVAEPSEAAVAALLERYIAATEALFEEHKAAAGYGNHKLVIL